MRHLLADRFEKLADAITYPFALHVEESFATVQSPEAATNLARAFGEILHGYGVTEIHTQVTAVELPRGKRLRAWVEYFHFAGSEPLDATTKLIIYASTEGDAMRAQMIQVTTLGFPEWKLALPRSAVLT